MKRMFIAAAMGCIGFNVLGAGPTTQAPNNVDVHQQVLILKQMVADRDMENQQLQHQVAQKDREIGELKRQLAERPKIVGQLPLMPSINPLQTPQSMPPGAVERKFNGQPYYVVPLTLYAIPEALPSQGKPTLMIGTIRYQDHRGIPTNGSPFRQDAKNSPAEIVPPELLNPSK